MTTQTEWDERANGSKDPSIIHSIKDLINHLDSLDKSNKNLQKAMSILAIIQIIIALFSFL